MTDQRHITAPAGFTAAGVACGLKASGRPDLAILAAERDASAAILTTTNQVVGAPVLWCRRVLPRGYGRIRGLVINSGCSNVCTGKAGLRDAEAMARAVARRLGCRPYGVLVASTGVIGRRLQMDKIRAGIEQAAGRLGRRGDADVVRAMMTTDLREKSAVVHTALGGKDVTLGGVIKGSGMIAPSLATMICAVTTDAAVAPHALHQALREAAATTLQAVTVDSDTSTSDTVCVLAGGAAGNREVTPRSRGFRTFVEALTELLGKLARALAADGEGATRLIEVRVRGARNADEARAAAMSVANSPLVKCAVHGADPNWGRVVMALGKSAARVDPDKLSVRIGGLSVFASGRPRPFDEAAVADRLRRSEVVIDCDLHLGRGAFTALTCDLSRAYIDINADYRT